MKWTESHPSQWTFGVRQTGSYHLERGQYEGASTLSAPKQWCRQQPFCPFIMPSSQEHKYVCCCFLVGLFGGGIYLAPDKTKPVQTQLQYSTLTLGWQSARVFTMPGTRLEASFRAKQTSCCSLTYSKHLPICCCWLRKGLAPRHKVAKACSQVHDLRKSCDFN